VRKPLRDLSPEDFKAVAEANHIWLNAFSCINPSEKFLADVGRSVLNLLDQSEHGDSLGISQMTALTVNKS
jgi:hypothetical protein